MKRCGAFVVTYRRHETLINTLDVMFAQTAPPEMVLIVDNANEEVTRNAVENYRRGEVRYAGMPGNLGPAGGAAFGLKHLSDEGYRYIHWTDDDDPPPTSDTFERLLNVFLSRPNERIGAVGSGGSRWDWRRGKLYRVENSELKGAVKVDYVPGGKQLTVSSEAVRTVGVPDEAVFFGFEDLEYCLRLKKHGFEVLVEGDLLLQLRRSRGNLKRPKGRRIVRLRNPDNLWRGYYSTRNYIWKMNTEFARPDLAAREVGRVAGRCLWAYKKGWKYGGTHLRTQVKAVVDGYLRRTGCRMTPPKKTVANRAE